MTKKILVVDDDLNILTLLTSRLKAASYMVVKAFDGVQAVRMAHKERPDLIILDIKMPAGGGLTVYEHLRLSSHTADIPVIFITAYPDVEVRQSVLEMGATDFIAKPFDSDELLIKIHHALGEDSPRGAVERR